jgi:deoxyribodipyrimidine photolyase-related protein
VDTIWVFGDQLNRRIGALATATPATARVLMIESQSKLMSKPWHRQRAHLLVTAMRRFATELAGEGFEVDYRRSTNMRQGLRDHQSEFAPSRVVATEPNSFAARELCEQLNVVLVRSNQFLCHYEDFAVWSSGRKSFKLEDFYRWQRSRLGYLMDNGGPVEGRWNFDFENREPPPKDGRAWPTPLISELDDVDRTVMAELPSSCWGDEPDGTWATSRREALRRLAYVIDDVLPTFGPHEDAMLSTNWHLSHSLLSPYLNLGLLLPAEVCDAVESAYRRGAVPIASAEGFIRQVIGWREFVWGRYWQWMPEYRGANELGAHRQLPPLFRGMTTSMRCVQHVLNDVTAHGYTHHIQRLMILGNLGLLAGIEPLALSDWMWASFVDGAEWVMLPNVIGMALYADGGRVATKPYAAGGAYIDRMSDYCKGCRYDRKQRTGPDACPFTNLYWSFLDRHSAALARNSRVAQQVAAARRLSSLDEVRQRSEEILLALESGNL